MIGAAGSGQAAREIRVEDENWLGDALAGGFDAYPELEAACSSDQLGLDLVRFYLLDHIKEEVELFRAGLLPGFGSLKRSLREAETLHVEG